MKLLLISQYFWPENFRINDLASEMVKRGHEVTVLTGEPNYPQGELFPEYRANKAAFASYNGAQVIRVPLRPRRKGNRNLALNYLSFALSASFWGPIKLCGREFDAMLVYQPSPVTVGIPALVLKAIKRTPIAFWILDLWPQSLQAVGAVRWPWILGAIDAFVRLIYRGFDLILVQSRSFVREVARQAGGEDRIRYFPSWSDDVPSEDPVIPAPEVPAAHGRFTIMFTGNVGEAQDFSSILDAAELLREDPVRWIVVGDGRRSDWLASEVVRRSLEDSMLLLGRYPLERMRSFLIHADATLVALRPEPAFSMTIPGKVQAYLAAGKPILAMIDGEGGDIVRAARAGFVAPAGDARVFAAAVRRMVTTTPEERLQMGRSAQAYARSEFDRQVVIDRLDNWLSELAARHTRGKSRTQGQVDHAGPHIE